LIKLIQRIYLFLLVFSPLAFGSVELWSKTIMEGLSFLALFVLFVLYAVKKEPFYRVPGIVPLLIFPAYIGLQMVPLPDFLVKWVSPQTDALYRESIGLLNPIDRISLSINPKETLSEFFRYGSYAAFYILSIQLLSDKVFLKKTVNTVVLFVSLLGFFAILQHFTADGKIYWFSEPFRGTPFGPYVNRNHFAGLAGMTFPLVLAMFLYNKPRINYSGLRTRLAEFFSHNSANSYFLLGVGLVLLGLAVFLSLSRGGIISLCLATSIFGMLLVLRGTDRGRGLLVLTLFSFVLLSVGWFGWDPIFERFNRIRNPAGEIDVARIPRWRDSLLIIDDYPMTGTGFGSYTDIYKGYRNERTGNVVTHAHNDYIELAVEGGIIAVGLAAWFLVSILSTYRRFLKRRDPYCVYLYLGGLTGLVAILIHSITDFNLHIGANGLYFYFICALCVSAAHTSIRSGSGATHLKPAGRGWVMLSILPAAVLLISSMMFNEGEFLAKLNFKSMLTVYKTDELGDKDYKQIRAYAGSAIKYDPFNSLYYMIFGNAEKALEREESAFAYFKKALRLNPANGVYLQTIAEYVSDRGDQRAADALYQAAIRRDVKSSHRFANYAFWLMKNRQKEKGIETLQRAITLSPRQTRRYLNKLVDEKLLENTDLIRVMPERVEPRIIFAEYLDAYLTEHLIAEKKYDLTSAAYKNALAYIDEEAEIKPSYFLKVYQYYMKQKQYEAALDVIQKGIVCLPENGRFRVIAGSLYEKLGINYRAAEEYKTALVFDPKNRQAKRRLRKLQQ